MDRMLEIFADDASLDLVGPFTTREAATKKTHTQNSMYIPFPLLPHVIGQNLRPKDVVYILVPVMNSLGLECRPLLYYLLAAATFTTGNDIPFPL